MSDSYHSLDAASHRADQEGSVPQCALSQVLRQASTWVQSPKKQPFAINTIGPTAPPCVLVAHRPFSPGLGMSRQPLYDYGFVLLQARNSERIRGIYSWNNVPLCHRQSCMNLEVDGSGPGGRLLRRRDGRRTRGCPGRSPGDPGPGGRSRSRGESRGSGQGDAPSFGLARWPRFPGWIDGC